MLPEMQVGRVRPGAPPEHDVLHPVGGGLGQAHLPTTSGYTVWVGRSQVHVDFGGGMGLSEGTLSSQQPAFSFMIKLQVNEVAQEHAGEPDMPLVWYLRDQLKLTGTKLGCGMGLCGSCTVHVNGIAVRSCMTTMRAVAGKKITTIEGLSPNGNHPVQEAWKKLGVPQCGYCQCGQIMQAASFLQSKGKNKPTDVEIETAMQGNLCRCGTYQRIRQAIKSAAEVMS